MALLIDFADKDTATCKAFYLYETTGIYGANNVGGYGTPNPAVGGATAATFRMVSDSIDKTIDVYPTLPKAEANVDVPTTLFPIQNTDLDLTSDQNIPSDIYLCTYTVTISGTVYTKEKYIYLDCTAQCCADSKMQTAIKNLPSGCDSGSYQPLLDAIYLQGLIEAVHAAIEPSCNEIELAKNMVAEINNLCAGCDCC